MTRDNITNWAKKISSHITHPSNGIGGKQHVIRHIEGFKTRPLKLSTTAPGPPTHAKQRDKKLYITHASYLEQQKKIMGLTHAGYYKKRQIKNQ